MAHARSHIAPNRIWTSAPGAAGLAVLLLLGVPGMWLLSRWNYLVFHVAVEDFSIVTTLMIFILAVAVRRTATNGFLVALGAGVAPVGVVLLFHMLAYKGMGVLVPPLTPGDPNPATQLWLVSRYVLAATMLAAPFFLRRRVNMWGWLALVSAVTALLVSSVLWWKVFPVAFDPAVGLTAFKVWSEYAVIVAFATSGALLYRWRGDTDPGLLRLTLAALGAFISAELFFTLYTDVTGVLNVLGHLAQFAGFILLTVGIVRVVLTRPMAVVYAELKDSERRLERSNRVLAMLSECRQLIADARTEQDLLTGVCRAACETGGYRLSWIARAQADPTQPVSVAASCGETDYLEGLSITWDESPSGMGPIGTSIRTGAPFVTSDTATDPRFEPWRDGALEHGLLSSAAMPIVTAQGPFGAIGVYAGEADRFDASEIAQLGQLTTSISSGLEVLSVRQEQERFLVELQNQRDRLEATVSERTADLQSAVDVAQEANQAKDQFMRSMSHELRTPLNSIIGFSQVMIQGLTGPLTAEQRTQLRMVNDSGRHLLGLVSEVLDLARIEAGAADVHAAEIAVGPLVSSVTGPMATLATEKGLGIVAPVPDPAIRLVSDESKIRQILLNLIGNALKFTEHGTITIGVDQADSDVRFAVRDTGPGIPEHELDAVLEEFHQVTSADGMKPPGTGLGLAIASRLAALIGGRITVESVVGEGSTFTLLVPVHPPTTEEPATPDR